MAKLASQFHKPYLGLLFWFNISGHHSLLLPGSMLTTRSLFRLMRPLTSEETVRHGSGIHEKIG